MSEIFPATGDRATLRENLFAAYIAGAPTERVLQGYPLFQALRPDAHGLASGSMPRCRLRLISFLLQRSANMLFSRHPRKTFFVDGCLFAFYGV
jgi:hypothetical protein